MGWNSWNAFGPGVNEALIEAEAQALVSSGLRAAGYEYVVLDGGWALPTRDARGNLQADPVRFPHGIGALAAYVHRLGLRFGIHQAVGMTDCAGRSPGTQSAPGGAQQDANAFAAWGVDFVKYDLCRYRFPPGTTPGAPDLVSVTVLQEGRVVGRYRAAAAGNLLTGAARLTSCSPCPGGQAVTGIGLGGGTVQLRGVNVPSPGLYTLNVVYVNVDHSAAMIHSPLRRRRMALLSVNGEPPLVTWYPVPAAQAGVVSGWNTLGSVSVPIMLRAGANTLTFSDPHSIEEVVREAYERMARAIAHTGRPMLLSICEYGMTRPWLWASGIGQMWRITSDVDDLWSGRRPRDDHRHGAISILAALGAEQGLSAYSRPGGWNDPDMLQVGNQATTPTEDRAMFSLWSVLAAPLMAGNDLSRMGPETRRILLNREVIAVDQDRLGAGGVRIVDAPSEQVWVKPLSDGSRAVVLLNTSSRPAHLSVQVRRLGLVPEPVYVVRDLWLHRTSISTGELASKVPAHGVAMFRVWAAPRMVAAQEA
jgi:alpha-galactosidase